MKDSRPSADEEPSVDDEPAAGEELSAGEEPSADEEPSTVINPESSDVAQEDIQQDSADQSGLKGSDEQPESEQESEQESDKTAEVLEENDTEADHKMSESIEDSRSESLESVTADDEAFDSYGEPDEEPSARLASSDLGLVGAVEVTMTLNVGSKRMAIADVLSLHKGSVVSLNRREHDPLDVMINGVLFARGEVVRTGEYYGLRILEIL